MRKKINQLSVIKVKCIKQIFIGIMLLLSLNTFPLNIMNTTKEDSTKTDSIVRNKEYPTNIFYEVLGSSVWMSFNYQQTIFSKNRYSLDFLTGINNWEFSEFDFINSHFFFLNRFCNKKHNLFVEFGPGLKLGGSLGERNLDYDISWNTSIMKVFGKHFFMKFNTTFSISMLYKLPEHEGEYTFYYGYASFPIGLSFGYRFNENKDFMSQFKNKRTAFPKNILTINSILGLGYERLLYQFQNNALYLSINPNIYIFKKYDISNKTGHYIFDRNFINYVQQFNASTATEFGVGYSYYEEKFSVFDEMFSINTHQVNLNMGVRMLPVRHFIIKFNYSPAIYSSNYNFTYLRNYVFNQLDQQHRYKIANKFFISIGYVW